MNHIQIMYMISRIVLFIYGREYEEIFVTIQICREKRSFPKIVILEMRMDGILLS